MPAIDVAGEFETIERLLRPLAHPEYARGLIDDVAVLPSRAAAYGTVVKLTRS